MLQKDQWMQIHVLKAQGVSEREIARRLGISRDIVARYLAAEDVPRYKQQSPRPTKLEAFEAYVIERTYAGRGAGDDCRTGTASRATYLSATRGNCVVFKR